MATNAADQTRFASGLIVFASAGLAILSIAISYQVLGSITDHKVDSYRVLAEGLALVVLNVALPFFLLMSARGQGLLDKIRHGPVAELVLNPVFIGIVLVVPVIESGVVFLYGRELQRKTQADIEAIADSKDREIERYLAEREADGKALAADEALAREVGAYLKSQDASALESIRRRLAVVLEGGDYEGFLLLEPAGRTVFAQSRHDNVAPDLENQVHRALDTRRVVRSDFYFDEFGHVDMDWIVPITLDGGNGIKRLGAIVLTVGCESHLFPLVRTWPVESASARSFLVRRQNDEVVLLSPLRDPKTGSSLPILSRLDPGSGMMPAASETRGANDEMFFAQKPILGTDWLLLSRIDRAEVMAPLTQLVRWFWLVATLIAIAVTGWALFLIRQRARAKEAARRSEGDLERAEAVAQIGSWMLDVRRNVLTWSAGCYRMFGIPPGTPLTYEMFLACVHPNDRAYVDRKWKAALAGEIYDIEHRIIVGDYVKWVRECAELQFDGKGQLIGGVGTVQDITKRKAVEEQLDFLAKHDPLTRLPNRRLMRSRLNRALKAAGRKGERLGIFMIDLDRFNEINDTFGHLIGDEMLGKIADEFRAIEGASEMVFRLDGDEFAMLVENLPDSATAEQIARDMLEWLSKPWRLSNGAEVHISASIGMALFPEHGQTTDEILQNVDAAMHQAKAEGRGTIRMFSHDFAQMARHRVNLLSRLRRAIEGGELKVFYQPQVDILTGDIVGAEALARWPDAEHGMIARGVHPGRGGGRIDPAHRRLGARGGLSAGAQVDRRRAAGPHPVGQSLAPEPQSW